MMMNPNVLHLEALTASHAGDYVTAVEQLDRLVAITDHVWDHHWRGLALLALGRYSEAFRAFEVVHARSPEDQRVLLAMILIKASAPDDDLRDARTAVALAKGIDASARSDDWSTLSVLAAVYAEVGDFDKAVAFIDEAIRCAPRALAERFVQRRDQYMKHVRYRLPAAGFDGLVSAARCDACGAVAFCSDGLPGTPRTVLCLDCAKRHFAADVDE